MDAHAGWRGLLLGYGCMVFGDTSESVDEVNCPRFSFCMSLFTKFDFITN